MHFPSLLAIVPFLLLSVSSTPIIRSKPAFPFPYDIPQNQHNPKAQNDKNQLLDGQPCRHVTVIYARGTAETGNLGGDIGQTFVQALSNLIGKEELAVQGVPYKADVPGFLEGGDPAGTKSQLQLISHAASRCPHTRIVLGGYSQGGQIVHNVAERLDPYLASRISSVVIFGDPDKGVKGFGHIPLEKVKVFCNEGDMICKQMPVILPAHLGYAKVGEEAAKFVVSKLKRDGDK